jgi:hypothetical protein
MRLIGLIILRTAFVGLLLFVALFACAFLLGYPGPLIIVAFSLGGLPAWVIVRRRRWIVAIVVAIAACIVPVMLLITYTADGDFTVPGLLVQLPFLGVFAYGFAYAGIEAGRFVWLPPERRSRA